MNNQHINYFIIYESEVIIMATNILFLVLVLIGIIISVEVVYLLYKIGTRFIKLTESKIDYWNSEKQKNNATYNHEIQTEKMMDYAKRMELTDQLLDLITYVVTVEIESTYQQLMAMGKHYDIANLDNDVKRISQTVLQACYSAIDINYTLLSTQYISAYIPRVIIQTILKTYRNV